MTNIENLNVESFIKVVVGEGWHEQKKNFGTNFSPKDDASTIISKAKAAVNEFNSFIKKLNIISNFDESELSQKLDTATAGKKAEKLVKTLSPDVLKALMQLQNE